MGGKKGGENSKKAVGQARKAGAVAAKAAAEDAKNAAAEAAKWEKGTKNNAKKEAEAAKKAEQARRKAENDALLAEDDKNTPGRALPKNRRTAQSKPSNGLSSALLQFESGGEKKKEASGSGINKALEVLSLDDANAIKLDSHPERRERPAYHIFQERRERELKAEGAGKMNYQQRQNLIRKEWEKSPENPMLQLSIHYNATQAERQAAVKAEQDRREAYLTAQ
ncbi:hypothetical protein F4777DRAFT_533905 [Nemania sp. FL0916]|nr:hypothetical protein F4777DRAFT_533905 [Nemania sp. FL0916]